MPKILHESVVGVLSQIGIKPAGKSLTPANNRAFLRESHETLEVADTGATVHMRGHPHLSKTSWAVAEGVDAARALVAALPAGDLRHMLIGDDASVRAAKAERPAMRAFTIAAARKCATDYRGSLLGSVPESCTNGVMLLTLDDLGFTLWGWPNRFLDRMAKAKTMVIIAQSVEGATIQGLTEPSQYGEIAKDFNGYIWVDKIEELGPALQR